MRVERWRLESVVETLDDSEETMLEIVQVTEQGALIAPVGCKNPDCAEHLIIISGQLDNNTLEHSLVIAQLSKEITFFERLAT